MNNWQQVYCETYYNGKTPRSKQGKADFELLGKVKSTITVEFPDFNGINGLIPAHSETYIITKDNCDMPNGIISVDVLISNLNLWLSRGYKITTK